MLLILAAHNPSTIGAVAWKRYPILRTLMEMCITKWVYNSLSFQHITTY